MLEGDEQLPISDEAIRPNHPDCCATFADRFTHASEGGTRAGGVATSICAVLLAHACSTNFDPLIRRDTPALGR